MSVPLDYEPRFGGSPAVGDAVAGLGRDCVIVFGGTPQGYAIDHIIARYMSPFALDYGRGAGTSAPGPNAIRSLTGRLLVLAGPPVTVSESNAVAPNPVLFTRYPGARRVLLDQLIHDWTQPTDMHFPLTQGPGVLRSTSGEHLSVVLIAPTVYTDPGGVASTVLLFSSLHVHAIREDTQQNVSLGAYHAV